MKWCGAKVAWGRSGVGYIHWNKSPNPIQLRGSRVCRMCVGCVVWGDGFIPTLLEAEAGLCGTGFSFSAISVVS